MKLKSAIIVAALGLALPAQAQDASGDADKGEKGFGKCRACHMIENDAGEVIVKGGKTGPNLFGLPGRIAGKHADFGYSDAMVAAGDKGFTWDEEHFIAYTQDPTEFLKEYLEDGKARSKMTFKLRKEEEARDIWAYLEKVAAGS